MAVGSRNDSTTGQEIILYFKFFKNGTLFDPYEFTKVEIYSSYNDAIAENNIIETITSGNITKISTGTYTYTISALSSTGTYHDKVFIIPESGNSTWTQINPFYVREEQYGGAAPGDHQKVRVYVNLFDIVDNAQRGDYVTVRMNVKHAWYGNDLIEQENEKFYFNSDGQAYHKEGTSEVIGIDLIETDTLTEDTFTDTGDDRIVYYNINIANKYFTKVRIPRTLLQTNIKNLPLVSDTDTYEGDL